MESIIMLINPLNASFLTNPNSNTFPEVIFHFKGLIQQVITIKSINDYHITYKTLCLK